MEKKKKQAMAGLPRLELDTDRIATKAGTAGLRDDLGRIRRAMA